VRGDRFLHLLSGQRGERQARLIGRPKIEGKRQLHAAVEVRRERNLRRGEVRRGLADESDDLDLCRSAVVEIAVAGGERRVLHVQDLAVILKQRRM
jgi:hypothetical protein